MQKDLRRRKMSQRFARIAFGLFAVLLFCSIALNVSAQNAVSRPAGFIRVTVSTNNYTACSIPFKAFDESINAILKDQLTGADDEALADRILKWNILVPGYSEAVKIDGTGDPAVDGMWVQQFGSNALSQMTLKPGEGFFVHNRQAVDQDLFLAGEVMLNPSNTMVLLPSANLIGFPYSTAADIQDTGLSEKPDEDSILDPSEGNTPVADQLKLGKGYWYNSAGTVPLVWTEVRPYADLFPESGTPAILDMAVADEGAAMEVSIDVKGLDDATLDIFYQDVTASNKFDTISGWQVAATGIKVKKETIIHWQDSPIKEERLPVNQVYARYYLVARSDIDEDGNGVADAREFFVDGVQTDGGTTPSWLAKAETEPTELLVADAKVDGSNSVATVSSISRKWTVGRIIYVDKKRGKDFLTGRAPVVVDVDGPKKTIAAGLAEARDGDTVILKDGAYNESLRVAGRNLKIKIQGRVKIEGGSVVGPPVPLVRDLVTVGPVSEEPLYSATNYPLAQPTNQPIAQITD